MGFRYWYEGLVFIVVFGAIILVPCFFIAIWGSKMINELGNFPTKAAQIQSSTGWKVFIVEMVSFFCLAVFFHIFNS